MAIEKQRPSLVYKIWGGEKLAQMKGVPAQKGNEYLGETWEVSAHPQGPSFSNDGTPLSEKYSTKDLPYLIKFIDTSDNLSVQVHPGDEYAMRVEKEKGKSECWFILSAEEGAGIYLGLKKGVEREELEAAIRNSADVSTLMHFYSVKKGDFFFVPAGTLHAIGKGVQLAEVQQCSGVTYRVWDWNRLDDEGNSRELHIDKALDVISFNSAENELAHFSFSQCQREFKELISHEDFSVHYYSVSEKQTLSSPKRPSSIICLEGEVEVRSTDKSVKLKAFEAALIEENSSYEVLPGEELSNLLYVF